MAFYKEIKGRIRTIGISGVCFCSPGKKIIKKYYPLIIVLVAVIFLGGFFIPRNPFSNNEVIFRVEKGEGSKEIALNLEKENLIFWGPLFRLYVLISGDSKKLQAGDYQIFSSMNIPAISDKMERGDIMKADITIPEGFDAEQIYQRMKDITKIDFLDLEENEGYLFPDTYEIAFGAESEDIIKIMTDNFKEKITIDLEKEIKKQGKTLEDIVIMASILEREVRTKEDKELASGILWKRLKIGMALQVDAAPITYERRGLPEGPICNPGLETIMAAIYPKTSAFWYYLSTPEGKIIYSKTLEEHNIARVKYLR